MTQETEIGKKLSSDRVKEICVALISENPQKSLHEVITIEKVLNRVEGLLGIQDRYIDKNTLIPLIRKFKLDYRKNENERNIKSNQDVEKYLKIILDMIRKEYDDKLNNLWYEIEERDREFLTLSKDMEFLQAKGEEDGKRIRQMVEEVSFKEIVIRSVKDEIHKKDDEVQRMKVTIATYENETRNKEDRIIKIEKELRNYREDAERLQKEFFEKEKKFLYMQNEIQSLIAKLLRSEGIIKNQEEQLAEMRKQLVLENDEKRRLKRELTQYDADTHRLLAENEKLRINLKQLDTLILDYKKEEGKRALFERGPRH